MQWEDLSDEVVTKFVLGAGHSSAYLQQIVGKLEGIFGMPFPLARKVAKTSRKKKKFPTERPRARNEGMYSLAQLWDRIEECWPDNNAITRPNDMALKANLLLRIEWAARQADLTCTRRQWVIWREDGMNMYHSETKRQDKDGCVEIDHISERPAVCAHCAWKRYLELTPRSTEGALFVWANNPEKEIASKTMASNTRKFLEEAGFAETRSHSIRSVVATALAEEGVPTSEILKTGRWKSLYTMLRHYDRSTPRGTSTLLRRIQQGGTRESDRS